MNERPLHVVLPDGWDDPRRPSGGNHYDRRLCAGLAGAGWDVRVTTVPCGPDATGDHRLGGVLARIPDGSRVLIDGLVASPAADQLGPQSSRLRLTVLLHMPLVSAYGYQGGATAVASEAAVLACADSVVVTSAWCRQQALAAYGLPPERVYVARPGTDPGADRGADRTGDPGRTSLLCVGVLAPHKGQDVLIDALGQLDSQPDWTCLLVGADDVDAEFAAELRARVRRAGLTGRVRFAGVLDPDAVRQAYAAADLLVVPSRAETYGMVVTEALAAGLPVLASAVGGLPEALGRGSQGIRPGVLVRPGDPDALAAALSRWCRDARHRAGLRAAARDRVATLPTWTETVRDVAAALTDDVAAVSG